MSRTFRRKGFEKTQNTSWNKQGNSVAGYYTEYDLIYPEGVNSRWYYWTALRIYREPTKEERKFKFLVAHGESHRSERTPSREYRQSRERKMRRYNKQELYKFKDNSDYEPMVKTNPDSHYWDWD